MKYFIGAPIPNSYKNKIELLRAEFRFLTDVCKNTKPFNVKLEKLGQFGNRVLFVNVYSKELVNLYESIYKKLNLEKENRGFTPHLTIVKQRPKRPIEIEMVKKKAEIKLIPYPEYTLNSIVVYHQPKEKFIYVPYMEIPFSIDRQ